MEGLATNNTRSRQNGLALTLLVTVFVSCYGQNRQSQLIKVGAFGYITESKYNGFSAHFEMERAFLKSNFFASGPRLDFVDFKNGDPYLLLGYNLKVYPFFKIKKVPSRGIFIGIAPVFLTKTADQAYERYGPGLSALLGYQYIFNGGVSLAIELNSAWIKDLNNRAAQFNNDHIYVYPCASVKVGARLSRWFGK